MVTVNEQAYLRFKAAMPRPYCDEQFRYYKRVWDVVRAKYLIEQNLVKVSSDYVDVQKFAKLEGLDYPQPVKLSPFRDKNCLSQGRSIDDHRIARALRLEERINLEDPLIVALEKGTGEGYEPVLIDGGHRLRLAFLKGMKKLKAYVLTPEQSSWVKIS
jgi:5-methylcytosine-specific restriction endonuclease McrA